MTDRILPAATVGQRTCWDWQGKSHRNWRCGFTWVRAGERVVGGKARRFAGIAGTRGYIAGRPHDRDHNHRQTWGITTEKSEIARIGTFFALQVMVYRPVFYYLASGRWISSPSAGGDISRPDPPARKQTKDPQSHDWLHQVAVINLQIGCQHDMDARYR